MDEKKRDDKPQIINIYDRKKMDVTGAIEVLSSADKEVVVKLESDFMHIFGSGLTISKLLPDEKLLTVEGAINGFEYFSKLGKKSFFGKVFK